MNIFHSDTYDRLSEKQKKAVDAYIENGFNVKDAAAKSGYNAASLSRWLKTEKARVCLKDYTLFLIDNKKDVLEYRIIDIYITRAFYNPADIIDKDGFLITDDLKSLGPLACCVEGIETEIKLIPGIGLDLAVLFQPRFNTLFIDFLFYAVSGRFTDDPFHLAQPGLDHSHIRIPDIQKLPVIFPCPLELPYPSMRFAQLPERIQ